MKGSLGWRIALTLLVTVLGVVYMLPSIPAVRGSSLGRILPDDAISLGLDLKGGIHLTLGVDMDKALENSLAQLGSDIRTMARDENIVVLKPQTMPGDRLSFTLLKPEQRDALESILQKHFSNALKVDSVESSGNEMKFVLSLLPEYRKHLSNLTVDQAVKTIRNRIDQFGVAEPDIRKQQDGRIQVQLPGLTDPERAIEIIGQTAHLEFKLVDDDADIEKATQGILPPGRELRYLQHKRPDGSYAETPIVLFKDPLLTGEYVSDARTQFDQFNQPYISMNFNQRGAVLFEQVTGENVKKRLAIVLDGKVYSAPVIQDRISGGRASISGQFTVDQAHDLAIVLRAGSLPAPVNVLEQRTVGPSLGQESIDKGINSALISSVAIVLFMLVYYGFAGLVANVVLLLNIVLIVASMAAFGATLTMPGIAGIVLTLAMAVDANVIIYERIREELKRGLTPRAAIDEGYGRAMLTIVDANLTTIIAALVLYEFGTGPVRGFAVTLTLGIISSLFTAVFVSRLLFDLHYGRKQITSISI